MTKRKVMINIESERVELMKSIFDEENAEEEAVEAPDAEESDPIEIMVEGRLITGEDRVELLYEEQEANGMAGSTTVIGFSRSAPELITMMRTGLINTTMVFEAKRRHICVYHTPFSEFEICTHALKVENSLLREGRIYLDYLIEVRGARAERCRLTVNVRSMRETEEFLSNLT